jgi:uncharacterized repeat protein (TIGR01451 family)
MKKTWTSSGIVASAWLAVFISLMLLPLEAHAARTITSATLNGAASVTVAPGAAITAVVNVTTDGSGSNARWRSTGWRIDTTAPGTVTCVDHTDHDSAGSYSETFNITAPAPAGTYNGYFIAYRNDTCDSDASNVFTMASAVTVSSTNPVPATTGISPASKYIGAATFTMTVSGSNFVAGSVVRFAGSNRTTSYVSATQLTATIPASDLTTLGAFNITVFNPTPGGGTSNAQIFMVSPAPPAVTTNAASGVNSWGATVNGMVSSNGASSTATFEYGLSTAYSEWIPATPYTLAAGAVNAAVSATLEGLNCNTTFHYRIVATNSGGTTNGLDGTFTTGACTPPFPETACAAARYGTDLGCSANDVHLTGIAVAPGSISSCVSGTPVTLDLDLTVNFATPDRYDIGIFVANDGKTPIQLPSNGGAASCTVAVLPTTAPFLDLDGIPQGTIDSCGDGNGSINGGTGSGVYHMTQVTLPCYASPTSGGKLYIPYTVSWDSQRSPVGSLCTSNLYPVPKTKSKCNVPAGTVSIDVVVLPKINKSHSGGSFNSGDSITYSIVVFNDSGGTLQQSVLTDPVVAGLNVSTVTCATANGSTCPATSRALIQGSGIVIPSANLPNNSSFTFTVTGTLTGNIGDTISNTSIITIGSNNRSSTDSVTLGAASGAKSFAPASITEGNNSLMTITFINPTASIISGVSFTDTYPSGLVNATSPNAATTCAGGVPVAAAGGATLAFSGATVPANGSCTVSVMVTSDTMNNYINTVTFSSGVSGTTSAILNVTTPLFGGFNACNVLAAPNSGCTNVTTPTLSRITTKIAGSPFNLDIVALQTNGSRNMAYSNTVLVELLDAGNNSGTLDAYNCRSSWTGVIATLSPNPVFVSGNQGLLTVGSFSVPEAYRDVRVRITNVGGTAKRGCSTDSFAIRPDNLLVSPTDTDWQMPGAARALNNTDAATPGSSTGSPPVHKAGQPFTISAVAINALNVTTANYTGSPASTVSVCSGTACTANLGTFVFGAGSFVSGILSSNTATYSEVGAFDLTLQDTDFASIDAVDTPSTCSGRYVCGTSPVGRFVPDHFDTVVIPTANLPMPCPVGLVCPALYNGFIYSGQAFSVQVIARNLAGATTLNYDGSLGLARTVNLTAWDAPGSLAQNPGPGAVTNGTVAAANFSAGVATTITPVYTFATTPTSPADIYMRAADTDAVSSLRTTPSASIEGGVKVVSGRIKIGNAHGSELLSLPMTAVVQYWNGTNWVASTTDNVTSFNTAANIMASIVRGPLASISIVSAGVVTVVGGAGTFTLDRPMVTGSVDISLNAPAYLMSGSNGAGVNPSRPGRATFGVYKGGNEFIYLRELY